MEDITVLLIGGSGIISSEVCSQAIQCGYDVTILNRGKRKNKIHPEAHLVVADVKQESIGQLKEKLGDKIYDVVVDFVSYDLPQLKKMLDTVKCNQYIFTSTATVYSEKGNSHPYREEDEKENMLWDYCIQKRMCEKYLENHYCENQDFIYTIVRPYVTYNETRFPFQVAPLEYYTIIYRILHNLPIVICGSDIHCTVTTSKEYAEGLVGLFKNRKAYNEDFHITTDNVITWKHIAEITADRLQRNLSVCEIPQEFFVKNNKSEIAVNEIIGDKGRNMTFDNTKIKNAVPEFKGNSDFDSNIGDILQYFKENNSKVNYIWCGCLDRLICRYVKENGNRQNYNFHYSGLSLKEKILYKIGKNKFLYSAYCILKKCYRIMR